MLEIDERDMPKVGVCIPAVCKGLNVEMSPNITILTHTCQLAQHHKEWSKEDFAVFHVFAIIGILVILQTMYEVYCIITNSIPLDRYCTAFSLLTNGKKLFNASRRRFGCLDGLKVLSTIWIMSHHRFIHTVKTYCLKDHVEVLCRI